MQYVSPNSYEYSSNDNYDECNPGNSSLERATGKLKDEMLRPIKTRTLFQKNCVVDAA